MDVWKCGYVDIVVGAIFCAFAMHERSTVMADKHNFDGLSCSTVLLAESW